MSLFRQLWLAVFFVLGLCMLGSFLISLKFGKLYLEVQLTRQSREAAATVALILSNPSFSLAQAEQKIAKQFLGGDYRSITLFNEFGEPLIVKEHILAQEPPSWFARSIALAAQTGVAQVKVDDEFVGRIEVVSNLGYAYRILWRNSITLILYLVFIGAASALFGRYLLMSMLSPLSLIAEQAEAIGDRRFIQITLPKTREFQRLVVAMNRLSERVRLLFDSDSLRLQQQQHEMQRDQLTGLFSRPNILAMLNSFLQRDDESSSGNVLLVRILRLHELNGFYGRELMDHVICLMGNVIGELFEQKTGEIYAGRLDGGDYLLLMPVKQDIAEWSQALLTKLRRLISEQSLPSSIVCLASTNYVANENGDEILARLDGAMAEYAFHSQEVGYHHVSFQSPISNQLVLPWQTLLEGAFKEKRFLLGRYPVVAKDQQILHHEAPIRLCLQANEIIQAGYFLGWAHRFDKTAELDIEALLLAIDCLKVEGDLPGLGLNVSPETFANGVNRQRYFDTLRRADIPCGKLWLEVPESMVYHYLTEFKEFAQCLKSLKCRVGIEHAGHNIEKLGLMHDVGLDYIKIDASLSFSIYKQPASQVFLQGIVAMAHAIGLTVIAEGVRTKQDQACLWKLGLDGMTGPIIVTPVQPLLAGLEKRSQH